MLDMEEFLVLRDLFNQGLSISEIARKTCHSRVTVRKYIHSQIPPTPEKRSKRPGKLDDYKEYIDRRLKEYPLTAARIYREIQEQGFEGRYTIVKDYVRETRPNLALWQKDPLLKKSDLDLNGTEEVWTSIRTAIFRSRTQITE